MSRWPRGWSVLAIVACTVVALLFFGTHVQPTFQSGTTSAAVQRAHFHSNTVPCDINQSEFQNHSKSQFREDANLFPYFKGLCNGTYLELGAVDGIHFSNTYAFHKAMNWKGVLIELTPENAAKLKVNRPDELAVIHAAVCATQGKVHYVDVKFGKGVVSGVWEFSAPSFRSQWWGSLDLKNTTEIDCLPMQKILANVQEHSFYADFFSLDVEGGELSVLESIDFSKAAFGIVIVEADEHSPFKNLRVRTLLASKGYDFMNHIANSDWFVNRQFSSFYQ